MNRLGSRAGKELGSDEFTGYFIVNSKTVRDALEGSRGKTWQLFWLIMLGVFAAGAVILAIFDRSAAGIVLLLECIFGFFFSAYIRFASHYARSRKATKRLAEAGITEGSDFSIVFGEDELTCRLGNGGMFTLSYRDIRRIRETTQLVLLITDRGQVLPLEKHRFVNGTEKDLWSLLVNENPKVKIERLPGETYYGNRR